MTGIKAFYKDHPFGFALLIVFTIAVLFLLVPHREVEQYPTDTQHAAIDMTDPIDDVSDDTYKEQ